MTSRSMPSGFLKNPSNNGIGRYVCQLQRLTFKFCKSHGGSRGTRDFIENFLLDFTRSNPGVVVYLKPTRHRSPAVVADYLNGYTETIPLRQANKEEVCKWVNLLRGRSGQQIVRLRKPWHTETPSVQGVWQPFTFKDPKVNVTPLTNSDLSKFVPTETSSVEKLLALQLKSMALSDGSDR